MKLFVNYIVVFCWILLSNNSNAQVDSSSFLLTYEQYLQQVYTHHPIAKQINLLRERANLSLKGARGGFDPTLGTNWDYKQFDDKAYYNILNAHIKVPTWIGLELEAGYNHANGYYLNPENKLPKDGQAYLSFKMPLLKGLWTDDRRVAIQQAKVLQEASEAEILVALNDLLYNAATAYWEWTKTYNTAQTIRQSIELNEVQLNNVKQAYIHGDLPAIDTLKVFIRLQNRHILLTETELDIDNAQRQLSTFLWDNSEQPVVVAPKAFPVTLEQLKALPLDNSILENNLAQLQQHPSLQIYDFKLKNLEFERRLKVNKLLPSLYAKYNFLSTNHIAFFDNNVGAAAPIENYKFGVTFSMPIFLRKERADLQFTKLKLQETNYLLLAKRQDLVVKFQNYFYTIQTYATQVGQTSRMVDNYILLLDAEVQKLNLGESSVFMINTRENELLDARLKLIKQQVVYLKSKASYFWVTANLTGNMR